MAWKADTIKIRINNGPEIGGSLTIDTEQVDVTVMTKSRPDPAWEHVDSNGHFHAYDQGGNLPTLESRSIHVDCACQRNEYDAEGWDCDGYDDTIYVCTICEETVEPKRIVTHPIGREYAPGRTTWELLVYADVTRGQRVSIRVTSGQPADEVVMFGVAEVVDVAMVRQEGAAQIQSLARLVGVGPLGERRKGRVPA